MSCSNASRGFSLLELIVAMAIMGVVSTIGATMFIKMHDLWNRVETRTDLDFNAQKALARFDRDFSEILSPRLTGIGLVGGSGSYTRDEYWGAELANDFIGLPVRDFQLEGEAEKVGQARYTVNTGTHQLLRWEYPFGSDVPSGYEPISDGILAMNIEYAGSDGVWRDEWSDGALPEAVRISLVLMDPEQPWEQIMRVATFPIRVD